MYELFRADQLLLLALDGQRTVGGVIALRGEKHVGLTHIAVDGSEQGKGIGRAVFASVVDWATEQSLDEVRWVCDPTNHQAIAAYLAWGARAVGWMDSGYGVDSDPCNIGLTPRLSWSWRADFPPVERVDKTAVIDDYESIRKHTSSGYQIVGRSEDQYMFLD